MGTKNPGKVYMDNTSKDNRTQAGEIDGPILSENTFKIHWNLKKKSPCDIILILFEIGAL